MAAQLRAVLQRGRWPRTVSPTLHDGGDQRVPRSSGAAGAQGTHGRSRLCVPPPSVGRHPNNSKPQSVPRRDEPGPWLQSPPAAQPVSPAQGAGAATARGGPLGQCRCTRRPRPVRARCVHAHCICPCICPCVCPCVRPCVRRRSCARCICPRCVPASVPALTSSAGRAPARLGPGPAAPQPGLPRAGGSRGGAARCPGRGRISAAAAAATRSSATSAPSARARSSAKPGADHQGAEHGPEGGASTILGLSFPFSASHLSLRE